MKGPCKECGHGPSWHTRWTTKKPNAFSDPMWVSRKGVCEFQDCDCHHFHQIDNHSDYFHRKIDTPINYSPEQIAKNEELKLAREPSIVIDKDFHELFCTVLKEETNRTCDCEGTTSEIRSERKS